MSSDEIPLSQTPVFAPPGHYYSPIVDVNDSGVRKIMSEFSTIEVPRRSDLVLDDAAMLEWRAARSPFFGDLPFEENKREGFRYYLENGYFEHGDGAVLFCLLRMLRPKRLIEVARGFHLAWRWT